MTYERSHELIGRGESRLLIVDVQEKLMPAIPVRESLIANCRKLIEYEGERLAYVTPRVSENAAQR